MDQVLQGLKKRYPHINELIFERSIEKARSHGELFDILEDVPTEMPVVWDEESRRWKYEADLLQTNIMAKIAAETPGVE